MEYRWKKGRTEEGRQYLALQSSEEGQDAWYTVAWSNAMSDTDLEESFELASASCAKDWTVSSVFGFVTDNDNEGRMVRVMRWRLSSDFAVVISRYWSVEAGHFSEGEVLSGAYDALNWIRRESAVSI